MHGLLMPVRWAGEGHLGFVVEDVAAAARNWAETAGVRRWFFRRIDTPCLFQGEKVRVTASNAFALLPDGSDTYVELVQPTGDGRFTATEWLKHHGPGLYHLGYRVADVLASVAVARRHGIEVDTIEDVAESGWAYLGSPERLGVHLEYVRADRSADLWTEMENAPDLLHPNARRQR
ncbi:MAG TPA: VOC family protein [Rariglobus sp.]